MIGLFDLPAPAFDLFDGWLAPVLPSGLRIVLWGVIAGAATMLLYWAFSPQARIAEAKRELGRAKRDLDAYDGAFADAAPLIRHMLGQALRQVGLVLGPALASGLPVLCLIAWLSGAFGHAYPAPAEAVEVRVTPPVLQAQWRGTESEMPEGAAPGLATPQEPKPAPPAGRADTGPAAKQKAEVVVTDERGGPVEWLTLEAPVPVLHKWIWWNLLLANPAGYLPDDGPVERVEIALPKQEHFGIGPSWARGWEFGFFLSLMLTALGAKFAFASSDRHDGDRIMKDRSIGTNAASAGDPFAVPRWLDTLGGLVSRHPTWWIRLGDLETRVVADDLAPAPIDRPIYVAGLARSGSTILLELLSAHPDTASHAYKDFPLVFAPWFWNRFLEHGRFGKADAVERAHGDGIRVTPDSPEAQEEMLWMAFFPHLHAPGRSAVLDAETRAPAFETFYRDHLRKLLRLRGGRRYLAKGNYNVTRLDYLLRLFPDARFVVPVREPLWQVASLQRQHERFLAMHRADPRGLRYMQRAGHFEFGQDRRTIEVDAASTAAIADARRRGAEVEAWARQWAAVYGYVADMLDRSPALRAATMVVRHEDLCGDADAVLRRVFAHCRLDIGDDALATGAARLHVPDYYEPDFTDVERQVITDCTRDVAARFGYGDAAGPAREELAEMEAIPLPRTGSCGIGRLG